MERQQQLLRFLFKKVDENEVIGKGREILDRIAAHISRLRNVEWCEVVTDIYKIERRVNLQQLSLYRSHQVILLADVRGEGDYRHSIVLLNQFSFIKIEFVYHFVGERRK